MATNPQNPKWTWEGSTWTDQVFPDWTYIPDPPPPVVAPVPAPVQTPPGNLGTGIGNLNILSPGTPTKEQFERLLFILSLSEVEREFCTALGTEDDTKDLWLVYSDWLEERGRTKHSKKARKKGTK